MSRMVFQSDVEMLINDRVCGECSKSCTEACNVGKVLEELDELPEGVCAEWIPYRPDNARRTHVFTCSSCGAQVYFPYLDDVCEYEYCPFCKATMIK